MFQDDYGTSTAERLTILFGHLQMESLYLDTVIETGLEIQEILREQRNTPAVSPEDDGFALQMERNQNVTQRLNKLRDQISSKFQPVVEARRKLPGVLKTLAPDAKEPPSLTTLLRTIEEPYRTKLKNLREEIQNKLNQVYSITMGNQTVLIFTLNYYDQLLAGNQPKQDGYDASGGLTSAQSFYKSTFITTNC